MTLPDRDHFKRLDDKRFRIMDLPRELRLKILRLLPESTYVPVFLP
jgi:hypothetical protein